jgi:hypothetical protein
MKRLSETSKRLRLPEPEQFEKFVQEIETGGSGHSKPCAELVQFLAFGGFIHPPTRAHGIGRLTKRASLIDVAREPRHNSRQYPTIIGAEKLCGSIEFSLRRPTPNEVKGFLPRFGQGLAKISATIVQFHRPPDGNSTATARPSNGNSMATLARTSCD